MPKLVAHNSNYDLTSFETNASGNGKPYGSSVYARWLLAVKFGGFVVLMLVLIGVFGLNFFSDHVISTSLTKQNGFVDIVAGEVTRDLAEITPNLPPEAFQKNKDILLGDVSAFQAQFVPGGEYGDAIRREMRALIAKYFAGLLVVIFVLIFAGFYWMVTRPNRVVIGRLRQIAEGDGDLTQNIPEIGTLPKLGRDEISLMASLTNLFINKTRDSIARAQEVFSHSFEMAGAMRDRATASEQATLKQTQAVEALAASMEELSATSQNVLNLAQTISADNGRVSEATKQGLEMCGNARDAAKSSNKKVGDIVEALTTIKSIAEATSRLSLNANIEAARAGEHGKGFAVVANEIRELAQQVAKSVKVIEGNITEAQGATEENTRIIENLEVLFQEVAQKIAAVAQNNFELAENVRTQTASVEGNNKDVTTLAMLATELSEGNSKTVNLIEDMNDNINKANHELNHFQVN
ncbi:MAG: methyl-accepting chemotaxis protein [Nitrospinae bacterium]|nr:methyl-accepting chemotaxis protein [Nitrospinota bacterium]